MNFWLKKKPVMGFHLGDFNILFEDWSEDIITTDVEASKKFINLMYNYTSIHTQSDKLDRFANHYWGWGWKQILANNREF